MVFRSLDVSQKYTCSLYVFLSNQKSFDTNISRHFTTVLDHEPQTADFNQAQCI